MKAYAVALNNKHGCDILGIFDTYAEAMACLYNYVKNWWDEVEDLEIDVGTDPLSFDMPKIGAIPEEHAAAVDLYFCNHPDNEIYEIQAFVRDENTCRWDPVEL